ncbi:alkaline shock response membrane anchor protein AmaP [Pseudonocardia sp. DSM 110487]|nr:alkaline shock response membrane anchor protein AmaP [Pseudonocardia sp. DSM 110487]
MARSTAGERTLAVVTGFVLLAAGTLVTLLSYGVFGTGRAGRPLLDPMIVEALRTQPLIGRFAAIVGGLLLAVLGLVWAAHALRPERRPDLVLDGGTLEGGTLEGGDTSIVVSAHAAAEAVAAQAADLPGVGRARARLVGTEAAPAVRVTLWLADDADVRDVLARLDSEVLTTARRSLGLTDLPAAVRLELDHLQPGPRVA